MIVNRSRGLIVPPGVQGNKITVRVLDAAGKPSGPVKLLSVKDVRLEDLPPPPRAAFQLGAACVACGNVADRFKCPGCAAPYCGPECFKREWKGHRVGCRQAQYKGAADSVRLLAYLGARLTDGDGYLFTCYFNEKGTGRVFDRELWQRISREGGDEGTADSLRKRIRMLKQAKVHDPRDGTSW